MLFRSTTTDIFSASDLIGRTVAVEKGFYTIDLLKKDFPGIKLLIVDNTLDALKAVSSGKADAYIGTQYVGSYLIKKFIISNLKTVGFLGDDPNKIYMGIRKDWPVLRDILNKGLASISDEEKQQILRKFIILDSGGAKKTNLIKLTDDEKAWLADHKHMRFGVDPGYPPFEFIDDDGVFSGMSSDYVRLVSERLGITMELVPGLSWVEVLDGVKNHTLDFTPALSPTVERNEHMNFTPPHMAFPAVIVTRDNHALVNGLEDLSGTTAALVKAVAVTDIVTAWHPGIITEMFDTPLQALQSVALGKTDATVMNLAVVTYLIKKHGLANLKIAAPAEVDIQGLSFGVRKDWPEFISIINKALASITPEEESAIRSRWAQVSYNTGIDIKQVIQAGGVVIVILIVIVVWNRRLQIEVNQRKVAEGQMKAAKNEAERLTIAKSDFIAVISHEIRTPMNGVLGMARLLTETKLDNEQEECVDTIVESGEALLTIIDDLLDISKFDAGKLDIESIPFIVDVVIEQSMSLMKSRAEEKGLKLDSDIDADIPGVIIGDPHRLRQIILNLISNAIKFTDKGTIDVETRMASRTENEATLSFVVTDTGKGIPPDGLAKIFSAYGQGSSEVARKYGGTGLGLAICRRLASRMNGEISVESEVGKGSAFKFEATFEIDNTSDANAIRMLHTTDKEPPSNEQTAHPMKVLQVEDNETNRTVVERVLSRVGHTVISVENGEVALQAIQAGDFDVILMDRHMPVMDGLEATRRIREMDGPVASIPIIGITASASQDEIQACIDAGMDDCLTKPVVAAKLRARLDTLHDGNHAPSSLPSPTGVDEPDTSSQQHPVDLHRLAEILGEDDDDELFSMLEIFNNEFPKLLDKLETAIRDGDVRDVHDCAHTAKGAAANAAAHTLSAILKEIEVDAHLENRALTDQRMQAVAVEYERVIHFCRNKGQQV